MARMFMQLRGSDWGLALMELVGGDLEEAELMQAWIKPVIGVAEV
jgi:hypothetical protein